MTVLYSWNVGTCTLYCWNILFIFMRENNLFICTNIILRYTCIASAEVTGCPPNSGVMIYTGTLDWVTEEFVWIHKGWVNSLAPLWGLKSRISRSQLHVIVTFTTSTVIQITNKVYHSVTFIYFLFNYLFPFFFSPWHFETILYF